MQFNMTRQGLPFIVALTAACLVALGPVRGQSTTSATAAGLLQQGISLYQKGQYAQAKQTLDRIDPVQLDAEQRVQFNKTVEKVTHAVNAQQAFTKAAQAEQAGDLKTAMDLYKQVTGDVQAPQYLREQSLEALARLEAKAAQAQTVQPIEPQQPQPAPITAKPLVTDDQQQQTTPPTDTQQQATGQTTTTPPTTEDLIEKARRLRVQQLLAKGKDAMAKKQYKLAEENFSKALALDPANSQVAQALAQARALAGRELPAGVLGDVTQVMELKRQNAIARYQQAIDKAKAAKQTGDFNAAADAVTLARTILDSNRQYLGAAELDKMRQQALDLGKEIETAAEQARLKQIAEQEQRAAKERQAERLRALKERDKKVQELLHRARDLVRDHKYPQALEHCEQVLFIDPNNAAAQFMKDMLEDQMVNNQWDQALRQRSLNLMKDRLNTLRDSIPQEEVIQYPPDWPQITDLRLQLTEGAGADSEINRRTAEKLAQAIPVDFKQNSFESVIEYLRNVTGVDIVPNWKALENAGIQRDVPVTLQMQNVPASKVLTLILEAVGGELVKLGYTIDEGVVIIATKEFLAGKTVIRAYDIRDLVVRVPDFTEAPEFDLSAIATDDVGGQQIFQDTTTEEKETVPRAELLVRIMDLIRGTVAPDDWRAAGGLNSSMEELNGTLIVNTTIDNHRAIAALLSQLREQRALQISIDGRFLFVTQNFLEDIGVDLDVTWNNTKYFASPALIANNTATHAVASPTDVPGSLPDLLINPENVVGSYGFLFSGGADDEGNILPVSFILDDLQVDLIVRATQADRRSISVNTPRLTFFNGQRAYVTVSRQISFVSDLEPVGSGDSLSFDPEIDVVSDGVVLDVEGTISADRRYVTLTVRPSLAQIIEIRAFEVQNVQNVNQFDGGGDGGGNEPQIVTGTIQQPEIQLSTVRTTVSVPDKGTLLLGGQRLMQEIEMESGVPVLSKIPVINRLFTNRSTVKDERTLLILVKPTIIIQSEIEEQVFPGLNQGAGTFNMSNQPMP